MTNGSNSHNGKGGDKISKAIDRVLTQVFGDEGTSLIYKHLERNYSLKRSEVGERIETFAEGLEEFLSSGAYAVERRILEDTYRSYGFLCRLELERTQADSNFVDQMRFLIRNG
jgi:hypothetical protein